jgi:ribosomal-protein-alanine N-acetyltransferase
VNLVGNQINVRLFEEKDAEVLVQLELKNREFFKLYTPKRQEDFYTYEKQLKRIQEGLERSKQDQAYSFGIFLNEMNELINWECFFNRSS